LVKKLDLDFKPTQELMKVYNTKDDDEYAENFIKKIKLRKLILLLECNLEQWLHKEVGLLMDMHKL